MLNRAKPVLISTVLRDPLYGLYLCLDNHGVDIPSCRCRRQDPSAYSSRKLRSSSTVPATDEVSLLDGIKIDRTYQVQVLIHAVDSPTTLHSSCFDRQIVHLGFLPQAFNFQVLPILCLRWHYFCYTVVYQLRDSYCYGLKIPIDRLQPTNPSTDLRYS